MNTSADLTGADLVVGVRRYTDPDVAALVAQVQAEYVVRYGGPDATPMEVAQFDPPDGLFLLGTVEDRPVACGGWRRQEVRTAEIKRMFVVQAARRRGFAARILAELERTAAAAGCESIVLETGSRQPEALALYDRQGYRPVEPFGLYAGEPGSVHLGKSLTAG